MNEQETDRQLTVDLLIKNALVFDGETSLSAATVAVKGESIVFVGYQTDFEKTSWLVEDKVTEVLDATGLLVTPGLIDCHTHIVHGGDRSHEYALRAAGRSYLEIAASGGGIKSTVRATRQASIDALVRLARPRLDRLLDRGVTAVEIKSGYGLSCDSELKILEAIKRLDSEYRINIVATFLGAHTIPSEYSGQRDDYVKLVIEEMLPAVAAGGLADFCDVFVEKSAFTVEEAEKILHAAQQVGLKPKLHADQLSFGGGAELAGRVSATSADHLEYVSGDGIKSMRDAGTVAVLLPGASLFLGDNENAPARRLIDGGVSVALATDCNPGTCMTENLHLMMTLAMSRLKMSAEEVFRAVTSNAAKAIGLESSCGYLREGRRADIAIFEAKTLADLPYQMGRNLTRQVYVAGQLAIDRAAS
ncbi:MAG: imidazolonepropionase [Myxococcota bacterium]|nr:imidazolonepropionase [Myxococcota bacterium]